MVSAIMQHMNILPLFIFYHFIPNNKLYWSVIQADWSFLQKDYKVNFLKISIYWDPDFGKIWSGVSPMGLNDL